jgi:phage baseplate assembly protein W
MPYGFTLPFQQATGSGDYFQVTETLLQALNQNVKSLLVTNWGERPMQYFFGCNLRQFLFEQLDASLAPVVADRIVQQFATWMPALRIDTLNILFEGDDPSVPANCFAVKMTLSLVSDPRSMIQVLQRFSP